VTGTEPGGPWQTTGLKPEQIKRAAEALTRIIADDKDRQERLAAVAEVVAPHMQAVGWSCPCCTAVDQALRGQQQ
jgi:hypothetical protein